MDKAVDAVASGMEGQTGEWSATMRGTKGDIVVRVCPYRKTDEQRRESECKLWKEAKRKRRIASENDRGSELRVVIVTILDCLDVQGILALYRHRWQVELEFKQLKSLLGL